MNHIRHLLRLCVCVCVHVCVCAVLGVVARCPVMVTTEAPLEKGIDHIHRHMCVSMYVCVRAVLRQSIGGLSNNLFFHHFHYSATATEREGVGATQRETVRVGVMFEEVLRVP